ncbi:MAG TPA: hypothetical protein VH081_02870 [Solirubrobacteraceae bacterium]|nr:hypothetical protein [Solirubrobacteraceae bacterium]
MAAAGDRSRRASLAAGARALVQTIREEDDAILQRLLGLSESRRLFAPLAFAIGAMALLLDGVRLLLTNWRLMLVQIVPALLIWAAMLDLRIHVLHGRSHHIVRGPILIPICLAIVALTAAGFYLNAVFAFAIAGPRPPKIGPANVEARRRLVPILLSGSVLGVLLAVATTISARWGPPWFAVSLGVVVAVMMIVYVAVPARLVGAESAQSRRDKLTASVLGGLLGATVCTPPYLLGRVGLLMLGSHLLLIPGVVVLATGVVLQTGATGAVRAVKVSARLAGASRSPDPA